MSNNKIAILLVHGILGTPKHFDIFMPFIPSNWSICNISLEGHGKGVRDFSNASMSKWKSQVHDAYLKLSKENDKVIILAHSMGTLFAINEALDNKVAALFLLNVPLIIRLRLALFNMTWKVFTGNIKEDDKWAIAAKNAYSIEKDYHILRYLGWIPRYLELFNEIRKTKKRINELKTPSYIYFSMMDEMVSSKSSKFFNNPLTNIKFLQTSGHFYYSNEDQNIMIEDFKQLLNKIL